MSFLSVLKVIGHDAMLAGNFVVKNAAVALPALVTIDPALAPIAPVINLIMNSIQRAETLFIAQAGQASNGPVKKQFVLDELANALPLLVAGLGAGGRTIDTTAIQTAAASLIDAIVSALNAVASFAKTNAPQQTPPSNTAVV